ncbi:MAG: PadR family transcriptional regulator [Solirubrobacteraceae bacterium]
MANTRTSRAEDETATTVRSLEGRARPGEETRSPVAWLVLGLLLEQPSHGYEVSQRYEDRFGSFAAMSVPRVYAALDRLRDNGLIEAVALDTARPVPKQHLMRRSYRVTAGGAAAYRAWVAERMREDPQRLQLLARIASAGGLGFDGVLDVIDRYERACLEELRALPTDAPAAAAGDLTPEQLAEMLIADQQRRELNARREWAVHARGLVQAQMGRRSGTGEAGRS